MRVTLLLSCQGRPRWKRHCEEMWSERVSYITTWRKNILSKGHSKCKGPEERGLVLLEDMQGSQGLELSEVHSEMEGLKWRGGADMKAIISLTSWNGNSLESVNWKLQWWSILQFNGITVWLFGCKLEKNERSVQLWLPHMLHMNLASY